MKNLASYINDDFTDDEEYFESCKKSKISCGKITERDFMKANRKASREEEIEKHGKPIKFGALHKSKKTYSRKDKYKKEF